jgi:hypothetical protein
MKNQEPEGIKGKAVIQHFFTKGRQIVELIKVEEDDCMFRFDDGSELAYEWNVISFTPIAPLNDHV